MGVKVYTDQGVLKNNLPRLKVENADVFPGSPIAVIGLWVFALRQRFADDPACPLPWVYGDQLRPEDATDGNTRPEGVPRKLLIDSAYNSERAVRNYRPAIYVGRGGGALVPRKDKLNNEVGRDFPTGLKAYHAMSSMNITMECESEASGESSAIAETTWGFVLSTRDIFRKDFGFHEISEPVMSDTLPEMRDKTIWTTTVQFSVSFDMRWGVTPIAPKLRDILLSVSTDNNTDGYLKEIALKE
jgi:hypothetical protein